MRWRKGRVQTQALEGTKHSTVPTALDARSILFILSSQRGIASRFLPLHTHKIASLWKVTTWKAGFLRRGWAKSDFCLGRYATICIRTNSTSNLDRIFWLTWAAAYGAAWDPRVLARGLHILCHLWRFRCTQNHSLPHCNPPTGWWSLILQFDRYGIHSLVLRNFYLQYIFIYIYIYIHQNRYIYIYIYVYIEISVRKLKNQQFIIYNHISN